MSNHEIHLNDLGTDFIATLRDGEALVDISTQTTLEFLALPPSPAVLKTWAASFVTDGTDGQMHYVIQSGDLDVAGDWQIQAHVITPAGNWHSNKLAFTVSTVLT
jgi:hypothetical protein